MIAENLAFILKKNWSGERQWLAAFYDLRIIDVVSQMH